MSILTVLLFVDALFPQRIQNTRGFEPGSQRPEKLMRPQTISCQLSEQSTKRPLCAEITPHVMLTTVCTAGVDVDTKALIQPIKKKKKKEDSKRKGVAKTNYKNRTKDIRHAFVVGQEYRSKNKERCEGDHNILKAGKLLASSLGSYEARVHACACELVWLLPSHSASVSPRTCASGSSANDFIRAVLLAWRLSASS